MSSASNDETKTAAESSTDSVATNTEPTVAAEVTDSKEAEKVTKATEDRKDQDEEDDDDDDEEEEEEEDEDEDEGDEDMPKWKGGMPRAPPSRPVAGIRYGGGNPYATSGYPPPGGR